MSAFIVSSSYIFFFFNIISLYVFSSKPIEHIQHSRVCTKYLPISINIIMIIILVVVVVVVPFEFHELSWWIYDDDEMCIIIYLYCICASIQHWFSLKLIGKDIVYIHCYVYTWKHIKWISFQQIKLFYFHLLNVTLECFLFV